MYFVFLYSKINVMTKLSVNINKVATLRNARGGKIPNVINFARDVQEFGAQGVTIHPRPDQRHIRYQDALDLKLEVHTEYNIEGNPIPKFIDLILKIKPTQVTLVPDSESAITSNAGWDCKRHGAYLEEVVSEFKRNNIRTSIFLDPDESQVESAVRTGVDRIELYTELFANEFSKKNYDGIKPYIKADTIPGKNPASKSCPTDSSTIIAYITNIALGGISVANVPPAATTPAASFLL